MLKNPRGSHWLTVGLALVAVFVVAIITYQIPAVKQRIGWRIDLAETYLRGVINPVGPMPTPNKSNVALANALTQEAVPSPTPTRTPIPSQAAAETPAGTSTLQPSPTSIPAYVSLPAPAWELQGPNNCGPASLTIYLRHYGWEGDQNDIAELIKPVTGDRNVNVEELVYYVRTRAGWLNAEFRVGGNLDLLKHLLAAGFPVLIEESFFFEETFWPNDDKWAAHYLLLTGYDDQTKTFTAQDSFHGPDQKISYEYLDPEWKIFNRVYILIYPPEQEGTIKSILGADWDVDANRQQALETAQAEAEANPDDPYAWFNIGTNQVYFGRYGEASLAYDKAREIGLPQRMLRYQFGPFFAYFNTGQTEELFSLTKYALERTDQSEEAHLWHGWALYRMDDTAGAIEQFRKSLEVNPNYQDAVYALEFVRENP
jgi:tetratricopeptide (TPR) repeat protein